MRTYKFAPIAFGVAALFAGSVLAADPASIDWKNVSVKTLILFYPGQSSFQWLRSSDHPGAKTVSTGGA